MRDEQVFTLSLNLSENLPDKENPVSSHPHIAILLASKNGARFLPDQLESFLWQNLPASSLIVSDDNSRDNTVDQIRTFATRSSLPTVLRRGPNKGAAQNFLGLIRACFDKVDYAAMSDQDDVWLPDKLERGVAALQSINGPAIYCSSTVVTDSKLCPRHVTPPKNQRIGFANALVECLAGGNTMILNRAALDLAASAFAPNIQTHDWFLYQLVTGAGGRVVFDPQPTVLYRQHRHNLVGALAGPRAYFRRLTGMFRGHMRMWNDTHIEALQANSHLLTPANRATLEAFQKARSAPRLKIVRELERYGIQRVGRSGQAALLAATLTGQF